MPTSQLSLKDVTSKRSKVLKRVIGVILLISTNVASYVVGNDTISVSEIVTLVVKTLAQCGLGG